MKKKTASVITMVKDDLFFLKRWIKHYGDIFGLSSLYVVNHGGGQAVADLAQGCNLLNIPDEFDENFDVHRWRLFNGLSAGLRHYFDFVIVTDVDEFIVVDPKTGLGLDDFLGKRRGKMTITPIGLEVVHKQDLERGSIGTGPILGPRRFARFTSAYSKPCLFNHTVKLSRGGHFADDPTLKIFRNLYLFHMRYADAEIYGETLARRQAQTKQLGEKTGTISWQWAADTTPATAFDKVASKPITAGFDFTDNIARLNNTWGRRTKGGELYDFDKDISQVLQTVPDRFFGVV